VTLVQNAVSLRRLGRDTAMYLTGSALARLVSFLMLPVYTRYLTPADYGILQILDLTVEIAAILVSAGATTGTLRFYYKATTDEARKTVIATSVIVQVGLNAVGTVLLLLAAPVIWARVLGEAGSLAMVQIAALNFTLAATVNVPLLLFQAKQQSGRYVAANVIKLALQLSGNILLVVVFRWGPLGILVSTMVTNLVIGLVLCAIAFRYAGLRFSRSVFRDLRRFGLPYQLTTGGTFILTFGDRFFLEHYHGLGGGRELYGLAYQFGFLLSGNVAVPFLKAWYPQLLMLAREEKPERDRQYNRAFRYGSLLIVTAAVTIALFIRPVLRVLVTEEFRSAAAFVPPILLAYVLQAWLTPASTGIDVTERTKYTTYATWSAVVVVLVLYALLIPPFGGMGAAVATVGAMLVRMLLHLYWSQRLWPIAWDWHPHLRLLAAASIVTVAALLAAPRGFALQVGVALLGLAFYAAITWSVVLRPEDREALRQAVRSPARLRALWSCS
jgi:O-antigen/teichoic acid export membrane protein